MTRNIDSKPAQRARDEIAEAWEHLVSAAEHGARQVNRGSQHARHQVRQRTALAALALRGGRLPSPWRWFAMGMAAGVLAGAAAGMALSRRQLDAELSTDELSRPGRTAIDAARDRASAAAHQAAVTARETASKVRDSFSRSPDEAVERPIA